MVRYRLTQVSTLSNCDFWTYFQPVQSEMFLIKCFLEVVFCLPEQIDSQSNTLKQAETCDLRRFLGNFAEVR